MMDPQTLPSQPVLRPWGSYTVISCGRGYQVKLLVIRPGEQLSLQWHEHRSEHWVVVSGIAEAVIGDETLELSVDESAHVPALARHRIRNPGAEDLSVIEVQVGDYLGEDDIVRLEDRYGRT